MITVESLSSLRAQVAEWHQAGERIGFVPTMGNLHVGHLALVKEIQPVVDRVVVSIFVNPTQFGPNEDFDRYPRTPEEDQQQLQAVHTDLLYMPTVETLYGDDLEHSTQVTVPALGGILCGASRPGHFDGVTTVVSRLFNQVQPDVAIFGQKDYQQLVIIRRMAQDLSYPIEIMALPTQREPDGLAMSSRNQYLSAEERQIAPQLHQALQAAAESAQTGQSDYVKICENVAKSLKNSRFIPEYVEIRQQHSLAEAKPGDRQLVILAAAQLGRARLIDNLSFEVK